MTENNEGPKAVILDMDGVITQTAKTHKAAWKEMFNGFLKRQSGNFSSMDDEDYKKYLDGKPRYKGVESFLQSRKIKLPYGTPEDSPKEETICGLGNKKNSIFIRLLKEKGVEVYDDAVEKIKYWRQLGLKTAVVSSSKNCKLVLEKAGLTQLFDARIDGVISRERNLKGKPNPDIFIESTKELDVLPEDCVLFEDAVSGVQAGSDGNFALVVGVNRGNNKKALSENGADCVIDSFTEIDLFDDAEINDFFIHPTPSFSSEFKKIEAVIKNRVPVLFLDYDGTLTPIVKHPEDAIMADEMKEVLRKCAAKFKVAAVSGRDMDDLKSKVGVENLIYGGSHGFRISGPDDLYREHEKTNEIVPKLNEIEEKLHEIFKGIKGVQIDRKRYAIGIHYRNANDGDVQEIISKADKVIKENPTFKKGEGKKIVEIKPDVNWHKGMAVIWITEKLGLNDRNKYIPVYVGDDVTDEDAFKSIEDFGIGILVGSHGKETAAKFKLKNVYQVRIFLEKLADSVHDSGLPD